MKERLKSETPFPIMPVGNCHIIGKPRWDGRFARRDTSEVACEILQRSKGRYRVAEASQSLNEFDVLRFQNRPETLSIFAGRSFQQKRQCVTGFKHQLPESLSVNDGNP